jgi:hypothetical protein
MKTYHVQKPERIKKERRRPTIKEADRMRAENSKQWKLLVDLGKQLGRLEMEAERLVQKTADLDREIMTRLGKLMEDE